MICPSQLQGKAQNGDLSHFLPLAYVWVWVQGQTLILPG